MSEIRLKCIDQCLHLIESPPIYSGDVNYDTVYFDFDSEWDNLEKSAVFYRSRDNSIYLLLDEYNTCVIPKEILAEKGTIYIGVVGSNSTSIITSQVLAYRIGEGSITEDTPTPTPDIFEQILMDYSAMLQSAEDYRLEWDRKVAEYRQEWNENVSQAITDANLARDLCYNAVSAMEVDVYDMNGGDPGTDYTSYEYDVNGGYPLTNS